MAAVLFDILDLQVGDVIPCTPGESVDRANYISEQVNYLEGRGFVVSYTENGRRIDFKLNRRRNQNA